MHIDKIRELRKALEDVAVRNRIEVFRLSYEKHSSVLYGNGTDTFVERSSAAGRMVFVGLYATAELELLGWAHEYGHVLSAPRENKTRMRCEVDAWRWAIDFFNLHDARFSFVEVSYALRSLRTYECPDQTLEATVPTDIIQELLALTDEEDPALKIILSVIDATLSIDRASLADADARFSFANTLLRTIVQGLPS